MGGLDRRGVRADRGVSRVRVAVVGAGISGMTAAYTLLKAGIEARIFEEQPVAGGRVVTLIKDGYVMDLGAEVFTGGYVVYSKLIDELGLRNKVVRLPGILGTVRRHRIVEMDTRSRWSMLTTKTLSFPAKLRLAAAMKRLKSLLADVASSRLHEQANLDDRTTNADQFGLQYFGREVTDYLIDPMVKLLGGRSATQSSAVNVIGDLKLALEPVYTFERGQTTFTNALSEKLRIDYNTKVNRLLERGDGVDLSYMDADGHQSSERFDAVVLATMFNPAVEIYPYFKEITTELQRNVSYIGVIKVFLGYSTETHCHAPAIHVPTREDREVMAIFLEHNKCPSRVPEGHSLLHCDTEVETTEKMIGESDAVLEEWARRRVVSLFPELEGQQDFCYIARWGNMANFNFPGYFRLVSDVLKLLPASGRIQVASDMFTKTHQEAAAYWGERAAENIIRYHS